MTVRRIADRRRMVTTTMIITGLIRNSAAFVMVNSVRGGRSASKRQMHMLTRPAGGARVERMSAPMVTSGARRRPRLLSTAPLRESNPATTNQPPPFKVNILDMSEDDIKLLLQNLGEQPFRAKQVHDWVFNKGIRKFEDAGNLPKALRAKLDSAVSIGTMELAEEQVSKDGTRKRAYRLLDGQVIESVLMPYDDKRWTACISSQAGCAMGCVFCATGQMGFARQLTATEIFEQAFIFNQELLARGKRLSNVVFMGMGEPLANYNAVMQAVRRINSELGIGARHITISTVGLVPRMQRLAQENLQVTLAVSLHASNDPDRSKMLPVNRRFPLADVIEACKTYVEATGRRMTFEWALIRGENDSVETAQELGRLLRPLKGMCHVNIIPLNPTKGYPGGPGQKIAMEKFIMTLADYQVPATPRVRRGIDIDAGCGQLKSKVEARIGAAADLRRSIAPQ